ncbi:MAG: protein phosphatase CheZ [Desulfovibrio sp.]|uniref:protein phosphatase CheZ n=1 Tax=Desulfovibrio sp. 7SRBS1 TaxID=3378064 RepID=UPI003B411620
MTSNDDMVTQLLDKVSDRVVSDLRESIARTVETEIQRNISRALVEGEFFRNINSDLQNGLKNIYQEISNAKSPDNRSAVDISQEETGELFTEASDQLDQILQTTEKATVDIMEIVEKHMELQMNASTTLQELHAGNDVTPEAIDQLIDSNNALNLDLMQIMTTLSFQDLTGQRIKKIIEALKKVEKITFDLFMSTGLKIKAKEKNPDKDLSQLEKETEMAVSELKGPQSNSQQADVDDLLAQLGMD